MAPFEHEKDWHPGSDGLDLDLVQRYGITTVDVLVAPECEPGDSKFTSRQFQWLPSDFFVNQDGKVTPTSPYINNVHLVQHKGLYPVIPEILQRVVPMFERVLADLAGRSFR